MDLGSSYVPPELLVNIIRNLPREDIKNLRRVCTTLNSFAAPFLFETLYISSRMKDREIFTAVSEHPIFSQSVQKVIYDSTNIAGIRMTRAAYSSFFHPATGLFRGGKTYTKAAVRRGYSSFQASYLQQIRLAGFCGDELTHPDDKHTLPDDFSLLLEDLDNLYGLAKFLPDDLVRLVQGLPRMSNVRHFEISDRRHSRNLQRYAHRYPDGEGKDLRDVTFSIKNEGTRGIDEVILDPRQWPSSFEEYDIPGWSLSWYRGFHVLTQAASMIRMKTLESFEVQRDCRVSGLTLQLFNLLPRQLHHTTNAFSSLRSLSLKVHTLYADSNQDFQDNLSRLSQVFASAKQLECLDFRFDMIPEFEFDIIPDFERIIGGLYWPKLRKVTFGYMNLTKPSFLKFFNKHCRTLRSLRLQETLLPDGTQNPSAVWEKIFQGMALVKPALTCFTFQSEECTKPYYYIHYCNALELQRFLRAGGPAKIKSSCQQEDEHEQDDDDHLSKYHDI